MDDNYIVNRIIDILENSNQNLLLGNISSPRPGSICQVSTDYGIKEAYNINCTYPGDAYVIWDKDEECYYCFTNKPSEVISSRQIGYRKYKSNVNKVHKRRYIIYGNQSAFYSFENLASNDNERYFISENKIEATNIHFEKMLRKLDPNIKELYISSIDSNGKFLGIQITDAIPNTDTYMNETTSTYSLLRYLVSKGIKLIKVKDTELDKVKGTLWIQRWKNDKNDTLSKSSINKIEKIAASYGVLTQHFKTAYYNQGTFQSSSFSIKLCLDAFYTPHSKTTINEIYSTEIRNFTYSNLIGDISTPINGSSVAMFDMNSIPNKNVLAYTVEANYFTGQITSTTKYATDFYWEN